MKLDSFGVQDGSPCRARSSSTHDPPGRDAGRRRVLLHGGQGPDRPAPGCPGDPLHRGRLARDRIPRTSGSSSACRRPCSRPRRSAPSARPAAPGVAPRTTRTSRPWSRRARRWSPSSGSRGTSTSTAALGTTLEENMAMIGDSIALPPQALRGSHLRRRALLRRVQAEPRVRAGHPARRRGRGRPLPGPLRHQRRLLPERSPRSSPR